METKATEAAEQSLLETERLYCLASQAREYAYHELECARQAEEQASLAFYNASKRRDAARRAVQDAYANERTS